MSKARDDFEVVSMLTRRDIKLFLKDKANVFFSLLAPLIVLLLYVLFLKRMQLDGFEEAFKNFSNVDFDGELRKLASGFLDGWVIAGMLSIGCITVSLSANMTRVSDRTKGIINDIIVSPVKQHLVKISYYLFNFTVTIFIMTIVYIISLIYLAISGTWHLSVGYVFAVYGTVVFSSISAVFFTSFITEFCKTDATLSALVGITSAMIGFIMGAYVPLAQMPTAIQYIAGILPGTHSAGMLREFLMTGALNDMANVLPEILKVTQEVPNIIGGGTHEVVVATVKSAELIQGFSDGYCLKLNFFGKQITSGYMSIYIAVTTVIFFGLNLITNSKKKLDSDSKIKKKNIKTNK